MCKTGGGCLASAYIQLSKIVVAEPLARMLPFYAIAQNSLDGILRNRANPDRAIRCGVLTCGISLALVLIAGFEVIFGLALVSVAYGEKIIEKTCECLAGRSPVV